MFESRDGLTTFLVFVLDSLMLRAGFSLLFGFVPAADNGTDLIFA